jgi:hypothetical protein
MKKIIIGIAAALVTSTPVQADAWHHGYGGYRNYGYRPYGWVAPAVIGGAIGYSLARPWYPPTPVYAPAPVYVEQAPAVLPAPQPVCSEWIEVRGADGTITQQRVCR